MQELTDSARRIRVSVVDYGLGNLFSVKQACEYVGMSADVTSARDEILSADAVILPGVGAFGDAMAALARLDLITALHDIVASGKPLMGICLGLQLLMSESYEFGTHEGLNIIKGTVVRLEESSSAGRRLKVPQIGWNRISRPSGRVDTPGSPEVPDVWEHTPLAGLPDGEYMYFVHSYYVKPTDPGVVLAITRYGDKTFCSGILLGNVFATQFHPERSGPEGIRIYANFAALVEKSRKGGFHTDV